MTIDHQAFPVFLRTLRHGQQAVLNNLHRPCLPVKLPTGYGKTFTALAAYSTLKFRGVANRLLVVFPSVGQLEQFVADGPLGLRESAVDGPHSITNISFFDAESLARHRANKSQVFAITIQALIQSGSLGIVRAMLGTGKWMLVIDEYHHYGFEKRWGETIRTLPCQSLLAMSATPRRPGNDSAFGDPVVDVSYRQAVAERVVKPLCGHSYIYRIDCLLGNGSTRTFTTSDLVGEVGSDSPDKIEEFCINRKMRWSPDYVSPLVTVPIERMLRERIRTGHRLQAIIGTMCVSHCKLVCEQVRAMYPELTVDWVGTGVHGRSTDENSQILCKFNPPKSDGKARRPEIDVLVHVGMAGEGLDTVLVSEVIHLNTAAINNSNNQENGRASRYLSDVRGHINFDSSSEFAQRGYVGSAIMDAMDDTDPSPDDEDKEKKDPGDEQDELPDEPTVQIWNMELEGINSGDPEVQRYKEMLLENAFTNYTEADLLNPDSRFHAVALEAYKNMRRHEAAQHNEQSTIMQLQESVNGALSAVTGRIMRLFRSQKQAVDSKLAGMIKKKINMRKKQLLGEVSKDIERLKQHYNWLRELEKVLIATKEVPEWLRVEQ